MHKFLSFVITTVIVVVLISCSTNTTKEHELKERELQTMEKELEIKEKELGIKEKELEMKEKELEMKLRDYPKKTKNDNLIIQEQKFKVPLGKTINGFHYSSNGQLTYNGINFSPNIKAITAYVAEFKISLLNAKKIAGAIAMDMDGQNFLFLLDLSTMTAVPLQMANSWNAAIEMYWSPSQKYMVALCSYEGQNFISINTETKKIVRNGLSPANNDEVRWVVDNEPQWSENKDIMIFNVAEYCDYHVDCGENSNKALAKYKINLDAATLIITKRVKLY